ncbi:Panacea domain-containing protein [Terracidiphilus sp.]|uniref:Panacea domain-containing protein n=1 Tax=Terracidiphilus sp. TaxID=1964191 RepID=UPI003C256C80
MATFNRDKCKTLVHYICARCEDNPARLGATNLNKILWYAETGSFLKTGKGLTGAKYVKRQHGPVLASMPAIMKELEDESKIIVKDVPVYRFEKKEYISLSEPDVDRFFSASDIVEINRIIDSVCDIHTAKSISDYSHNEAWHLAEIGEELPLYTILAVPGDLTETDMQWADAKIAALK